MILYLIALAGTVAIITYQVYVSVSSEPVWWSAIDILEWAGIDWAENPTRLKPLHAMLRGFPICFVYLFVVGGIAKILELIFTNWK